jgi:putative oxidoreductase
MNTRLVKVINLLARLMMALIFFLSGLSKLGAIAPTQGYMEAMGLPGFLLWPTILFEVAAGLLLVLGYRTAIVAFLLAGFCLVSAVIFHRQLSDQIQLIMFLKNISMAGGFLYLSTMAYAKSAGNSEFAHSK